MTESDSVNESEVLRRAAVGDDQALWELFSLYRGRLKAMVRLRISDKIRARLDDSDVLQETMLEVARRLKEYVRAPTVPFYLWLRRIALHKLIDVHRRNLAAGKRDADRELRLDSPRTDSSSLAKQMVGKLTSPSRAAIRAETCERVQEALQLMEPMDREVLAMRHFEQMTNAEAALVLGIEPAAASKRYTRAIQRLKRILDGALGGEAR